MIADIVVAEVSNLAANGDAIPGYTISGFFG